MEAVKRAIVSNDWITLVLLAIFILLVLVKYTYPRRFENFFKLFATNKYLLLTGKEPKISHPFNILMFGVNVISVSFFIFLFYQTFVPSEIIRPKIVFVRIATAYSAFVLLKFSVEKIMANILSLENKINFYLFHKWTYRNFIALFLLPANIAFIYIWKPGLTAFYLLFGLIFIMNLLVHINIYKKNQQFILSNWFYFILYLCALEIGPYFILYKVFTN